VERGLAGRCPGVHVCLELDEQLNDIGVAMVDGLHQRSLVVVRACVHVRVLVQELPRNRKVACLGGKVQRSLLD